MSPHASRDVQKAAQSGFMESQQDGLRGVVFERNHFQANAVHAHGQGASACPHVSPARTSPPRRTERPGRPGVYNTRSSATRRPPRGGRGAHRVTHPRAPRTPNDATVGSDA